MPPTGNSKISFAIKVYDTSRKKDKKKIKKVIVLSLKIICSKVNKNLILFREMRILNKHLVKKTFKGIAFFKIESTSIEKTKIVTCSSYQIPNFEFTNPDQHLMGNIWEKAISILAGNIFNEEKLFSKKKFVYFRTAENSGFVNSKLGIWSDKHVKKHTIHTPRDVSNLTMIKKIMVLRYDTYLMLLPKHRVQIINYLPTL